MKLTAEDLRWLDRQKDPVFEKILHEVFHLLSGTKHWTENERRADLAKVLGSTSDRV